MSTKTTFKRIALVAVAVMSFGTLSAAPSTAAVQSGGSYVVDYVYSTANSPVKPAIEISSNIATNKEIVVLRDQFIATAANDEDLVSISIVQTAKDANGLINSTLPAWDVPNDQANYNAQNNSLATVQGETTKIKFKALAAGRAIGQATIRFEPQVAGTYIFRISSTSGWSYDHTVVAVARDSKAAASTSTSILNAGIATGGATDATVTASKAASNVDQAASIVVTSKNAASVDLTDATALTATISGPGTLGIGTVAGVANIVATGRAITGQAGSNVIAVFPDGSSGVATITISQGTTVLSTETVTFYGDVASVTVTPMAKSVVDTADGVAAGDTDAFVGVVSAKDAAGVSVPVAAGDFTVSSAAEKTAQAVTNAAAVAGVVAGTYNGVAVTAASIVLVVDPSATMTGAKTLTLTHNATSVATTFKFTVALAAASTVSVTNNQGSPAPGQKITYTVTAKDAGGNAIPDGSPAVAVTTSLSQSATLPATLTFVGGVATFDLFAPITPGAQTVTVTKDGVSASTSSDVIDLTQPATDAAAEAIDAANAATDAANAAAEAADAATAAAQDAADAVAALSVQVSEQIAALQAQNEALRKQLVALTNLIIKIQKKVKA